MGKSMKVLFLAAEADPLAKVGGLADVAGSLPAALRALPQSPDVRLVIPFYPPIKEMGLSFNPVASFLIPHSSGPLRAEVYELVGGDFPTYLIDGSPVADSARVYSGDNYQDGSKFTFFSLAALKLAETLNWKPDILHAHDWHTCPALYKLKLSHQGNDFFQDTKSLLTVHNLPYLGFGTEAALQAFGLPRAHMSGLPVWAEHLPLPLGLLSADLINTVSPGYAQEILTPEYGAGLEEFLQSRQSVLKGILNGLDLKTWDPQTDPHLPINFSLDTLSLKRTNKIELLKELGLPPDSNLPLLAMINRMDYQKGVDLVPDALRQIQNLGWQAVILGTGSANLEKAAEQLDHDLPRVRSILKYDDALAHRIYGGSDLILIPSRYEPCGLTQMIGMRYGCVPLARATGGLQDTIQDYNLDNPKGSTGFLFKNATAPELAGAISKSLEIYADKRRWSGLQHRGMKKDFSWNRSAEQYLDLYRELSGRNHK
jgi:starch synthase